MDTGYRAPSASLCDREDTGGIRPPVRASASSSLRDQCTTCRDSGTSARSGQGSAWHKNRQFARGVVVVSRGVHVGLSFGRARSGREAVDDSQGVVLQLSSGFQPYPEDLMAGASKRSPLWLIDDEPASWQLAYVDGSSTVKPLA